MGCGLISMQRQLKRPPKRSLSFVLDFLVFHARLVSAVLVAAGVLGLLLVPMFERSISFDENALLAGSAKPTIRTRSSSAFQNGKTFTRALSGTTFTAAFTQALQERLKNQLGLEVSNHTFTVRRAAAGKTARHGDGGAGSNSRGAFRHLTCTNVHAVLHSRRGDGKEALVLVTPVNHQGFATDYEQQTSGVQLTLALGASVLSHLSTVPWLAKEVIWLLPDASCGLVNAVEAWTSAYQYPPLPGTRGQSPEGQRLEHFKRAGMLQQALVVELPSDSFNRILVSLEGWEGSLPKLDMFWLIRWFCWSYVAAPIELPHLGAPTAALTPYITPILNNLLPNGGANSPIGKAVVAHVSKITIMCQFIWRQAWGLPTGAHAPFKGLMVDAATLRIITKDPQGVVVGAQGFIGAGNSGSALAKSHNMHGQFEQQPQQVLGFDQALMQLGEVLELILRSCNVLIERFHHSLFLYVLTGLNEYVSVERYIGPVVVLIGALLLQGAYVVSKPAVSSIAAAAQAAQASTTAQSPQLEQSQHSKQTVGGAEQQQQPSQQLQPRKQGSRQQQEHQQQAQPAHSAASTQGRQQTGSQQQQQEGQAEEPEQLQLYDELQLQPQVHVAAAIAEWVAAVQKVAAVHAVAAAAGVALRQGLELLLPAPAQLIFAAMVLSAAAVMWLITLRPGSKEGAVRKVLAVELSVAAAVMAALACVNWALAYATCLVLVPLAICCVPLPQQQPPSKGSSSSSSGDQSAAANNIGTNKAGNAGVTNSSDRRWEARGVSVFVSVLLCCCPVAVLLVVAAVSGAGVQAVLHAEWLLSIVQHSSKGAYLVWWIAYVPYWCIFAWAVIATCL